MTANHEHTPSTEQVRNGYSRKPPGHAVLKSRERQAAEFDRWLAERDARIEAAAEQRGAERVLREIADHMHENTSVIIDGDKYTACSSCTSIYRQYFNDRADQMEGDE